ncbi:MAG: hypothetical protein U1F70_07265 [Candidatus Competibacteraceae bacterium]
MKPVLLVLSIITAAPAFGQVYKCPGSNGQSYYQQLPCPEGSQMSIPNNGASSGQSDGSDVGLRPGERDALESSRQREEAERQAAEQAAQPTKPASSETGGSPANEGSENSINESTGLRRIPHRSRGGG